MAPMLKFLLLALAVLVLGASFALPVRAADRGFVVGGSIGGMWAGRAEPALASFEGTLLPDTDWPTWWSGGVRATLGERGVGWIPYVEGGSWLLLAAGAGVSLWAPDEGRGGVALHLFLGLPVPVNEHVFHSDDSVVVEPYWRPTLAGPAGLSHEAGVMLKYARARFLRATTFR